MTLNTELLFGKNPAAGGYQIERSLRFNSSDSAYLSRTPASAGNRKTWTWAGWVKRSALNATNSSQCMFGAGTDSSNFMEIRFSNTLSSVIDTLNVTFVSGGVDVARVSAERLFRDISAWYHIVVAFDTTQAAAANRVRIYVNGSETGYGDTSYPNQNSDWFINNTVAHAAGRNPGTSGRYLDGYLADVHFIDGQALDPTSFGEFGTNGVWQPIAYTGTYGTNGFHLPFSDNSTAAALGTDTSGNGNDWTTHNLFANNSGFFRDTNFAIGTNTQGATDSPGAVMFDGSDNTGWGAGQTARTNEYTLTTAVSIPAGELWAFVYAGKTGVTVVVENAGGSTISSPITSIGVYHWLYLGGSPGSIKKVRLVDTNPSYGGLAIYSFRVDSTRLVSIDPGSIVDSLVDTPTNYGTDDGMGGSVRGNYATLNPIDKTNQFGSGLGPLSNGNLELVGATSVQYSASANVSILASTYSEFAGATQYCGLRGSNSKNIYLWWGTDYYANGVYEAVGTSYSPTDVVGIAYNPSTLTVTFYKNGVSQFSKTLPSGEYVYFVSTVGAGNCIANFGQRPFAYPAPSGFKALCTTNLPEPQTITTSGTYTGNGVADGPFVYLNGVPTAMTVNGNAVTFGTQAEKLSNGFKVRTTSTTYNQNAVVYNYSITSTGAPFNRARAQTNP